MEKNVKGVVLPFENASNCDLTFSDQSDFAENIDSLLNPHNTCDYRLHIESINDSDELMELFNELIKENVLMQRRIIGLETRIKNLESKIARQTWSI